MSDPDIPDGTPMQGPDLVAMMDQARASLDQLAKLLAAYADALLAQRFAPDQAFTLVLNLQASILNGGGMA
jgi:hypothetical protein